MVILRLKIIGVLLFSGVFSVAQVPAFPDAEGFGRYAKGGRGGSVYHVTNLEDFGPGSFRDAVSQPYRIVIFDVGGVIRIKSKISTASYLTIAGQSAPGEGITVYGDGVSFSGANDVIVRYIRFRGSAGMGRGTCTISADDAHDLIFDHVSIEWGRWDNLHIKNSRDVTLQYCLIGEGINPQMFGALLEHPDRLTIHHCLWVDNQSRNPKAKAGIEFVNNVIYNWRSNGFVGGHSAADHFQDLIGNYFIAGPNSSGSFIGMFTATDHVYQRGNLVDLIPDGNLAGRPVTDTDFSRIGATVLQEASHTSLSPIIIESAADAYRTVLKEAGASMKRDDIDKRLVGYVGSLGKEGKIIHSEEEVGGEKSIGEPIRKRCRDEDGDGLPDIWEKQQGLDPSSGNDGPAVTNSGYANLEIYLNGIE